MHEQTASKPLFCGYRLDTEIHVSSWQEQDSSRRSMLIAVQLS